MNQGIHSLGENKADVFNKAINVARQSAESWKEGSNEIRTAINGIEATVRVYVRDGIMKSIDVFVGYSNRANMG